MKIVEKAYKIDLNRIEEGYIYSDFICHAENRNQAKKLLLDKVKYESMKHKWTDDEITYLNIPIIRCKEADKVVFENEIVKRYKIDRIIHERDRVNQLNNILNDPNIKYCYIRKHGSYYGPNNSGYTSYSHEAGVYSKEDAVDSAKSCDDLTIIPIVIEEHNKMLRDSINRLSSKIIDGGTVGEFVLMPKKLTAENGSKGLMIGEFFEESEYIDENWESIKSKVPVEWDTIKDIYNKLVDYHTK